jgi:hypothetical protein
MNSFKIIIAGLLLSSTSLFAQISTPMYVYNLAPVRDEFNRVMKGNASDAVSSRCLVEIRAANSGIFAPAVDGAADAQNPLIETSGIGANTSVKSQNTGTFCAVLVKRPAAGSKIFARVYNAPTVAAASFYVDSEAVTVSASIDQVEFVFGAATPFDDGDDDGDGLCNSLEKSLGSDPQNADTLGNGLGDLVNYLAGFDFSNPNAGLYIEDFEMAFADGVVALCWNSAEGRRYQVAVTESLTDPNYTILDEVTAAGASAGIELDSALLPAAGAFFQIRVIISEDALSALPAGKFCNFSKI